MNEIPELLDLLRARHWTDSAIADALGTTRQTVSQWRGGQSYPRYHKAIKMALRGLMMQEPPKGKRYSKEALDTWQREGRYSESRAKGDRDDRERKDRS